MLVIGLCVVQFCQLSFSRLTVQTLALQSSDFVNRLYDYRPKWTPLSAITILSWETLFMWLKFKVCLNVLCSVYYKFNLQNSNAKSRKKEGPTLFLKYTYCFCSLKFIENGRDVFINSCLLYTSPSPRDA